MPSVRRHVGIAIPAFLNEIDRLITGQVAMAVPGPVAGMLRRHSQVDRLARGMRRLPDHDRLGIDQHRRRQASDVDAPRGARARRERLVLREGRDELLAGHMHQPTQQLLHGQIGP